MLGTVRLQQLFSSLPPEVFMRALLSWDIDPGDSDFQRILFDLASLLPPDKTTRLTTYTALVDPITTAGYKNLAKQLRNLTNHYDRRLFIVLSLHPAGAAIWGRFRSDNAGFSLDTVTSDIDGD